MLTRNKLRFLCAAIYLLVMDLCEGYVNVFFHMPSGSGVLRHRNAFEKQTHEATPESRLCFHKTFFTYLLNRLVPFYMRHRVPSFYGCVEYLMQNCLPNGVERCTSNDQLGCLATFETDTHLSLKGIVRIFY